MLPPNGESQGLLLATATAFSWTYSLNQFLEKMLFVEFLALKATFWQGAMLLPSAGQSVSSTLQQMCFLCYMLSTNAGLINAHNPSYLNCVNCF